MRKIQNNGVKQLPLDQRPSSGSSAIAIDQDPLILAISLRVANPNTRTESFIEALEKGLGAPDGRPRIVLLPGYEEKYDWPCANTRVLELVREHGAAIIFEQRSSIGILWQAYEILGGPLVEIRQKFIDSKEANLEQGLVRELIRECQPGGKRTIRLSGLDIGLLSCGENNVLINHQIDKNRVSVRHNLQETLLDHVQVIHNGAHSNMGNWDKLNKRFEFLSSKARMAIFSTNNSFGSWKAAVRVYIDGTLMADGEGVRNRNSTYSIRVLRDQDQERDGFCAISVIGKGIIQPPTHK